MEHWTEDENTIQYRVEEEGVSLEEFLRKHFNLSGRLFRRLEKSRGILVNGQRAKGKKKVVIGDHITIIMEDERPVYHPEPMALNRVYEDHDLLLINKEPGLVVHPTKSHSEGTLTNGIAHYFKEQGIRKKVRLVNRLDMDTSGILVVAKNPFGHQQMAAQFENNGVQKKYLAVVKGHLSQKEGIIDLPIGRDEENPIKNMVREDGKPSKTKYRVMDTYKEGSLVQLEIMTGRTHQIRVHLKHLGHPIIGDTLYDEPSPWINRQALHSYYLKFKTPRTNEWVEVEAQLPEDMQKLIKKI